MRASIIDHVVLAVLCLLIGCTGGTEIGNPPVSQAQLALAARASDPEVADVGARLGGVLVEQAWVVLGDLRFVQNVSCDESGDTRIDVAGPTIVDLAADPPAVVELELPRDEYCRLRVPFDRGDEDLPPAAPAELESHAIVVLGSRDDGTPFVLSSDVRQEVDVRSRGLPFAIDPDDAALVLAFDVSAWFAGVDLDAAAVDGGAIVIDDSNNRELREAFEENVERSLALYRDEDGDGELDETEDDAPLAEGGP